MAPYAGSELAASRAVDPQLLNAVDEEQVEFCSTARTTACRKKDGVRQFVTRVGDQITGGNRKV